MRGQCSKFIITIVIITILSIPIRTPYNQVVEDIGNSSKTQLAETSSTWHDDCSSTVGWASQSVSSGFDPKHPILESGTLTTSGGYLTVSGIADPVTERKGPLYIKELSDDVSISNIELFQAEVEFTYYSDTFGFLSVYLFDENKQKAVMLRLHDAWAASESHPESVFFDPGEVGDGTVHDEILFGSWTGFLRFWYDGSTGDIIGELDDGTPNQATLKTSGTFDAGRRIKYVGIQWSRHPGLAYNSDGYRLLDIQLTYEKTQPASDWLTGWNYRKSLAINGSAGAGPDYQVKVLVQYGSGIDGQEAVYCDNLCNVDFSDIRFTDDDGTTELAFWRESFYSADNATFWVRVSDDLSFSQMIYLYFGNPGVATTSDGQATFDFFDDFETGSFERWDSVNSWSISSTYARTGTYGAYGIGGVTQPFLFHNMSQTGSFLIHIDARTFDNFNTFPVLLSSDEGICYPCAFGWTNALYHTGSFQNWPSNSSLSYNTWYNLQIGIDVVNSKMHGWKDGAFMGEVIFRSDSGTIPSNITGFRPAPGTQATRYLAVDNVYIRKWIADEPSYASWGALEFEPQNGSNWLTGWMNRKSYQILGTPGAGMNYQIPIIVYFGSGTDSTNSVYCDSKCQPDFDDIRFTRSDGYSLLDYWTESVYDSDNTTFWVEVKDNLDFNTTIYMYYGNSAASTISNGTATFIFFDDFESGNFNKWDDAGSACSIESSTVFSGSYSALLPGGGSERHLWKNTDAQWSTTTFMVHVAARLIDPGTYAGYPVYWQGYSNTDTLRYGYTIFGNSLSWSYGDHTGGNIPWSSNNTYSTNVWYQMEGAIDVIGDKHYAWKDSSFMGESLLEPDGQTELMNNITTLLVAGGAFTGGDLLIDDYFVRKWIASEPVHGLWSDYESWLMGWNYRKSHEIIGSLGAGENYQMEIVVHYDHGPDSGRDVFCDRRCQSDFDDIRFTDNDGYSLLDYWTESVYDSDNATFWVEVKDNLDFDTTIYMYYGNATVSTISNGTATFIFFDDFENDALGADPNPARWWLEAAQDPDDYVRIELDPIDSSNQVVCAAETGDTVANVAWTVNFTYSGPVAIGQKFRYDLDYKGYFGVHNESSWLFIDQLENLGVNDHQWFLDQTPYDYSPAIETTTDRWFSWEYRFSPTGMTLLDRETGTVHTGGFTHVDYSDATFASIRYGLRMGANKWWTDDMYVRKFVSSEPAHGEWKGATLLSWHHDCSNSTGFVYNDTWNINWMPWVIQPGTLASDGSMLSVTSVVTGSGWHGPVFEYELPRTLRVRDIENFTAFFDVDNSLNSYLGYEGLMFGDSDRNPILFCGFHDGWADYRQGSYGISYGFLNGSRSGVGSGYPVGWTSFSGKMNASFTEAGLLLYVDGLGEGLLTGLSEGEFNREIKYVAIASARFGSDPLIPVHIDEIYLNYEFVSEPPEPPQPSIDDVEDFGYEVGTSGNVIVWTIANFTPTSYELYRDGGLLTSDIWLGGSTIEVDIDNLSPGEYNYTIVVFGEGLIEVSDTVIITVADTTGPSLGNPLDVNYELGSRGHSITWTVADLYPDSYIIYQDGVPIETNVWTSGTIQIDIDGLGLGVYDFSIEVNDTSGNVATNSVIVTVADTTSPFIDHPTDIVIDIQSATIQITWRPTDLRPFNYEIYRNGTTVASGTWASGENLTYSLGDDLTIGTYNYTVVVWDTSGNYNSDTVIVTIEPIMGGDYLGISISIGSLVVIIVVAGLICRRRGSPPAVEPSGYNW